MLNGIYYNHREKFFCAIQDNKILDAAMFCMTAVNYPIIIADYDLIKLDGVPDKWLSYASVLGKLHINYGYPIDIEAILRS